MHNINCHDLQSRKWREGTNWEGESYWKYRASKGGLWERGHKERRAQWSCYKSVSIFFFFFRLSYCICLSSLLSLCHCTLYFTLYMQVTKQKASPADKRRQELNTIAGTTCFKVHVCASQHVNPLSYNLIVKISAAFFY